MTACLIATCPTLVGHYQFAFSPFAGAPQAPIDETDTATVHYSDNGTSMVVVVGGGFKRYLSRRSGVRFDARMLFGQYHATATVDAGPSNLTGSPTGTSTLMIRSDHPAIQFSTSPQFQSSLSGSAISGVPTFTGGSLHFQISVAFGYFIGF